MRQKLTEVQANMTANDNNYLLYAKLSANVAQHATKH
jgi:hypothetical protein